MVVFWSASIRSSVSTNLYRRSCASRVPTLVLPTPMKPVRMMFLNISCFHRRGRRGGCFSVFCLLSSVFCLLSSVFCLLSSVFPILPPAALLFHFRPELEVLHVCRIIPSHLIEAVSAEFFDHGRRNLESRRGLRHHPCRGHGADIRALHARLERFLARQVHLAKGLHERGDRLHRRAQNDVLPVADPALDAAGIVRLAVKTRLPAPEDLVVHEGTRTVGHPETGTYFHSLDRLDAHERRRKPAVELSVRVRMTAEPHGRAGNDHLEYSAEGVPFPFRLVDLFHHPLFGVGVSAPKLRGFRFLFDDNG